MRKFAILVDTASGDRTRFASAGQIDLSVEWKSLFHKRLVGKIKLLTPELLFTKDKVEPKQVAKDTVTFRHLIDIGMPLDINRIEVEDGSLRYHDLTSKPPVDIGISDIYVMATNLKNVEDSDETLLPSSVVASADVYKGTIHVDTRLNLLKDDPTFELKAEIKDIDLTDLNNFFMAYGKFTIDRGIFSLYSEAAAKNGAYTGYLKPLINDLHVAGPSNRDEKFITKLWEHVIDATAWVFKNHKHDQLATKIPFAGTIGNEHTGVLYAIFAVLRNAFIEALSPSLDNEIDIASVGKKDEDKPGKLLKKNAGDKSSKTEDKLTRKEKRQKKKNKAIVLSVYLRWPYFPNPLRIFHSTLSYNGLVFSTMYFFCSI